MVPGLHADALVDALALRVSASASFPTRDLVAENARRGRDDAASTSCSTPACSPTTATGTSRSTTPKAAPDDLCIRMTVRNAGPSAATLHVLPTLWFRNRWSWDRRRDQADDRARRDGALVAEHADLGRIGARGRRQPEPLFCDNETQHRIACGARDGPPYPEGRDQRPRRRRRGDRQSRPAPAPRRRCGIASRSTAASRPRSACGSRPSRATSATRWSDDAARRGPHEADDFYASLAPAATPDEQLVMRQAFAGMLWSKQFYHYDVDALAAGRPGAAGAAGRAAAGPQRAPGDTSTTATSSRCPTSGSTPGTPPGTSPSTA